MPLVGGQSYTAEEVQAAIDEAVAAGGGGGGSSLIAIHTYASGSDAVVGANTSSTSFVDVDATNAAITFDAPASGNVLVRLTGMQSGNGYLIFWGLREGGSDIGTPVQIGPADGYGVTESVDIYLTGLSAGSHTYKWSHRTNNGSASVGVYAGPTFGEIVMEVWGDAVAGVGPAVVDLALRADRRGGAVYAVPSLYAGVLEAFVNGDDSDWTAVSGGSTDRGFRVDLGKAKRVTSWRAVNGPRDAKLQYGPDGSTWTDVPSGTVTQDTTSSGDCDITARWWQVVGTEAGGDWVFYTLNLYGYDLAEWSSAGTASVEVNYVGDPASFIDYDDSTWDAQQAFGGGDWFKVDLGVSRRIQMYRVVNGSTLAHLQWSLDNSTWVDVIEGDIAASVTTVGFCDIIARYWRVMRTKYSGSGGPAADWLMYTFHLFGDDVNSLVTFASGVVFVIDGGGSAITTGVKGDIEMTFAGTLSAARLLADQTGSIVVDLWKDTYANFPPVDGDSITASAPPTISSAAKSQDTTLTGWTTAFSAGDIIRVNVDSCSTITRCTLALTLTRGA